jgi:hypothetical protein
MKKKSQSSGAGAAPCLCEGAGPALSELLRRLAPPEEARRHFQAARLEFLKGLRAVVDARIEKQSRPKARGQAISIQ